jgi:hypothetical protein
LLGRDPFAQKKMRINLPGETGLRCSCVPCGANIQPGGCLKMKDRIEKRIELRVLESAGIVHSARAGRESLFEFDPQPMEGIREYLDLAPEQPDQSLSRLYTMRSVLCD